MSSRGRHRHGRWPAWCLLVALLSGSAALGAVTTSPARATVQESSQPNVTFTVGILNEVDSFNPFLGIVAESYEAWALMYDYMITYSMKDMSPQPGLATSWGTTDHGLTWTFHIRSGVKWSDGKPLTAHDIAYTYNRVLHGSTEAASWGSYLKSVKTITAPNDTTVVLRLDKPNAVLPLLPIPIVPEHIWKHISEKAVKSYSNEPSSGHPIVGSGPFRFVSGTSGGSTYVFERNPHYWGGEPHISQVIFRVYKAEDPLVQALLKGEVDFAEGISPIQIKAMASHSNISTVLGDSPGFDEIAFNTGSVDLKTGRPMGNPNPAMLDPRFRHALGYAIDRTQLAQKVYQGGASPGQTLIPPEYPGYHWQPPTSQAYTFDLKRAGQLLDAAGYKMGSNGLRTMPDGSPIGSLRLFARSESPTSIGTMQYFQEWLKDIGINSAVTSMESNKLTQVILSGAYDMFQWGWYVEPDPDSMLSYMTCGQRGNWSDSWYCNKTYDALYDQQHAQMNQTKRDSEVKRMQRILWQASPYQITIYNKIGEAYRNDLFHCFTPQPDPGGILLFQYGVYNYQHAAPASQPCDSSSGKAIGSHRADAAVSGSNTTHVVVTALVVGLLMFGAGGALGGFAGYRKASVDFRE
ncbi:MAG: ABC transporter substrate-binding protein [Nocardioidaceae bacterium]